MKRLEQQLAALQRQVLALTDRVNGSADRAAVAAAGGGGPAGSGFLAKITGRQEVTTDTWRYSWVRLWHDGSGELAEVSGSGATLRGEGNAIEFGGREDVPQDTVVTLRPLGLVDSDESVLFGFSAGAAGGLFAVKLIKDGGSDGNSTTQASWTYTVKSIESDAQDQQTLGEAMTPQKQRPAIGTVTHGDGEIGMGYYDAEGVFYLFDANEVKTWEACS